MRHRASRKFWPLYESLSPRVRDVADKNFELLKQDPRHPSLQLKMVSRFWSVRVGSGHRALAVQVGSVLVWFWIGDHDEYNRIIGER